MERLGESVNEPNIDPARIADLQFRTRPSSSTTAGRGPTEGLWWQIALGVFMGLLAHSVVTGLYARYEMAKVVRQLNAETERAAKQLQQAFPSAAPVVSSSENYEPAPLREGERCINGRRFARVDNGWRQVNEPCT